MSLSHSWTKNWNRHFQITTFVQDHPYGYQIHHGSPRCKIIFSHRRLSPHLIRVTKMTKVRSHSIDHTWDTRRKVEFTVCFFVVCPLARISFSLRTKMNRSPLRSGRSIFFEWGFHQGKLMRHCFLLCKQTPYAQMFKLFPPITRR